jgi:hypothetical protein
VVIAQPAAYLTQTLRGFVDGGKIVLVWVQVGSVIHDAAAVRRPA